MTSLVCWLLLLAVLYWYFSRRMDPTLAADATRLSRELPRYTVESAAGLRPLRHYLIPLMFMSTVFIPDLPLHPLWRVVQLGAAAWLVWDVWYARPKRVAALRERLESEQFRLCPRSLYSLAGLAEDGDCPECGRPYHSQDLPNDWERLLTAFNWFDWRKYVR